MSVPQGEIGERGQGSPKTTSRAVHGLPEDDGGTLSSKKRGNRLEELQKNDSFEAKRLANTNSTASCHTPFLSNISEENNEYPLSFAQTTAQLER